MPNIPESPPITTPESSEERKILRKVKFERQAVPGGGFKFTKSTVGRKIIILDHSDSGFFVSSPEKLLKEYDVEIVRDTKPHDPARGALIVRIIGGAGAPKAEGGAKPPEPPKLEPEVPMEEKKKEAPYVPLPVERDEEAGLVYVLETAIPLNPEKGEAVPQAKRFKHFTLDGRTLETIEKIATAVELREPCLLEGETSTSKTSSIEYLGMMSNNEVVRFNLNGQTDTSELIGKFVPNDEGLQVAFEELLRAQESLSEKSKSILKRANSDGRGLSKTESQQIAEAEGLKVPDWRWQDGLDVIAKKKGQWLILDEINLAEAQILERINSQLEKHPTLTLSENGGTVIRELDEEEMQKYKEGKLSGVEPLSPNFRIFATMNPAEYSGRQPMSPAYKDRWTSYKFVESPKAKEYAAMMNLMIYGWQPEVQLHGGKYKVEHTQSMLPTLEKIPNFSTFIPKLAKFQETVEDLAHRREIGRSKKEPYIFTRRGIIEFLTYLENKTMIDRKTKKRVSVSDAPEVIISRAMQYYYLDKISNPDDLKKVKMHLDALGISENNWTHKFK